MLRKEIIIFLSCISLVIRAQTPSFYAQVSKNKVAVGEVFQIAFTLEGSGTNLTYPNFKDFDIYAGPNQSQSVSMVNGHVSQSITISLFLAAKHEGKFVIGSASIVAGGQKLETKPITIEVSKGAAQQPQAGSMQGQGQQAPATEKNQYASAVSNEDLFVRTFLSKTKCYLGEQITLTQKVYSRVDLRGFQNVKFPPYTGFWSQQEDNNKQISLQTENIDGINYYVAEYNKVFLFPQRTGKITIEPVELECIVRRQSKRAPRNIFEQFFGAGGYEDIAVKVKSKPVSVDVVDLPEENKPSDFTGAVGNFSYKTEISKDKVKANDAFNLKLTISGRGNIKLVEPLKLNLPESFEVYDPKVNESIKTIGSVSGSKTYDYLIIPREKGEFVINNLNFSYFDADKKQYVTIPSPDINLTVLEGEAGSAQVIAPSKRDVKETGNDIRYIKTGNLELQKAESEFFGSGVHYALLIAPVVAFGLILLGIRLRIKANSDIKAVRERKAAKMARKQLVLAEKYMHAGKKDEFFNEVLNALHKYIGHKFGLSIVDMSKEKISEMLIARQVSAETTQHLINTLNTCEYARYAPSAVTGDLKQVYSDTVQLISQIQNQIKN